MSCELVVLTNWLNVFNPYRLFGSWSMFVATGLPPGCCFSKMDAINLSSIGLCCSFGAFNCNYAQFSLRSQTINLLSAVQEFMNHCIYFVLQSCYILSLLLFVKAVTAPAPLPSLDMCCLVPLCFFIEHELCFSSMSVCLLKKHQGWKWWTALTNRIENVFSVSFKGPAQP